MFKKLILTFLFLGTSHFLFSQITISSPVIRQIFQRDLSNKALVTITGSYSQPIDTLQARFISVRQGQGTDIDWTVIKSAPLGGLFKGSVIVRGGWYVLEVRGLLNGKVVGNVSRLERVGVGEVFIIAGQSNAGGSSNFEPNETAAADDRVNCANFISPRAYFPNLPFFHADITQFAITEFSQLKKTAAIAPTGLGPYYWGKVGDALAAKLNVPIMFFNTGYEGTSSRAWRESAENPDRRILSDFQFNPAVPNLAPVGCPYVNLSGVLRYYGINLGVRAVLWIQGETDNLQNFDAIAQGKTPPVTVDAYLDNLTRVIKKSRQDFGTNKLAWVIAQTSYSSQLNCLDPNNLPPAPSPTIRLAQNRAISDPTLAPMYAGPLTDTIQVRSRGERSNCVHFTGKGLDNVAAAWVKSLTDTDIDKKNFFDKIEPILADTIPSISLDCISPTALKLTLPDGYSAYEWTDANNAKVISNTKSTVLGSGSYTARVTRSNGSIVQVPQVSVRANNPPKAPIITALSDVSFCLGTSVTLQSSTEADNPIYEWTSMPVINNIPRLKDVAISREGTYKLRVIDKNACVSPYSTEVKLTAKLRPETPTISTSGSTEFCEGQSIALTSSNVGASSYLWSTGENTQLITVKNGGSFSVQTRAANGCLSQFSKDNIFTKVNPLPASPQIRALSDTVFCDGGSVSLVSTPRDNSTKLGWERNSKISNDNTSPIKVSGTELVRGFVIDSKNCNSNFSNTIQVVKKDNPSVLTIFPKSTYSMVARSDKKADEYVWKLDGKIQPTFVDSLIRPDESKTLTVFKGSYTVIGKNVYKVKSSLTPLNCQSAESEKFEFNPYDDNGLSVFPNPSNGRFYLESQNEFKDVSISVFTIDGKLVYEKTDTIKYPKLLDLSFLTEGTYIIKVGEITISKLIRIER